MAAPLRARNVGDTEFIDAYDGELFRIGPNEEALVSSDAVALWFGDPDARNEELNRRRDAEVERLKVRYGHFVVSMESEEPVLWEEYHPQFEIMTMDGERIYTVLDDPSGSHVTQSKATVSDQDKLMSLIESQSEELARLKAEFKARQREAEARETGHASEDAPKAVASKRARQAKELHVDVPEDLPTA